MGPPASARSIAARLAWYFQRNGYVRKRDAERRSRQETRSDKKGYEVRLVAGSQEELAVLRDLLARAGFTPGRPFRKGRQYRLPVYGRDQVARFLRMVEGRNRGT
jgi:hypothetical protein